MANEENPTSKRSEEEEKPSRIKGGWLRALLILPAFIIVQQLFSMLSLGIGHAMMDVPFESIRTALKSGHWPDLLLFHQGVGLIGTLLLIGLFRYRLDRRDLRSMGLKLRPGPFLAGLLLGPLMIGTCYLILYQMDGQDSTPIIRAFISS
jgi:hypothetical protein